MAIAGIVAGGTGSRMGGGLPKQWRELGGKPVLIRTAEAFLQHPAVTDVIIGIHPDWYQTAVEAAGRYFDGRVHITRGGSDRNDTVMQIVEYALGTLRCGKDTILLTHDAVRPFVTMAMIDDSIAAMQDCMVCTAAIAATDTIVLSQDGTTVSDFPPRSSMYQVQTPQTFRAGQFAAVYQNLTPQEKAAVTDVCKLFERKGMVVRLIPGDRNNIKLTYPADFIAAEAILKMKEENK